ncbi:SusC/RagA family TonB-linked outer membrane protein [Flavisolibacter ginsenosidimutans]|uniref:TonB-dependent receptor n=1 Tax=Flavisolibacter ginsenosidimutans TaxID=661481 RepID=A0A5B8UI44_9BACT|nr:TonB-dependent receptor [Flavisolibacter ginsenosidimutans]QEC56337.1 TonB-dependent receptor [Flavisolibacter ginsenosidimutans]
MKISVTQNPPKPAHRYTLIFGNVKATGLLLLFSLFFVFTALAQRTITVRGRIVDEKAQPVVGASVVVKGTTTGTSTNANGEYQIVAPVNGTLEVSSVGYPTKEISIANQANHNVTLTATSTDLEQVVVIGYGTQKKEAVTGSVASIGGEKLRDVPTPNISQALQGRIAGVDISQTSTRPGATMQIRIRGDRSLTGSNDPLVVLDGIPFIGSIGDINPNDIKSVDILKDASATAIYGSRGANGVILVTTNRGQRGQKPRISYNAYTGLQTLFAKYPMMNGPEFAALRKAANNLYPNSLDESDNINTDWQDLLFRNGLVTDHSVSMVGGSQQGSYTFGLGYYQNQGLIPSQKYTRYSIKGSVDQQVGDYFRFGFTSNSNYNLSEGNQIGLYGNLSSSPLINLYNPNGVLKTTAFSGPDQAYVLTKDRIDSLNDAGTWLNQTRGFATYNSLYGEVSVPWVKGLKYRLNVGGDFIQSNNGGFTGAGVVNTNPTAVSSASISNTQTYHWTIENILSYDRSFGKSNISVLGLYSAEQTKVNGSSLSATDIPNEAFQFYNLGSALATNVTVNQGTYQQSGLMSYMGRVIYSYDNRYFLTAIVRSDASSRLAPGNKWHTYPAASVGWNVANESFMKGITPLNALKLRAGFGQTSNQAVPVYSTLGALSQRPYNFGSSYAIGYYVSQLPNPGLSWEYSKTLNLGIDFGLFRNRLTGTIEYYITKTEGILQSVSLPPTSGVGSVVQNVGKTQNKGIELSLNGTILNNVNGWTWEAGFNIYANRNKLVALADGSQRDEGNSWFVGHNINSIFDYKKIGLWSTAKDSADNYMNILEPGYKVGMIKVLYTGGYDANGKPLRAIGTADRQIIDVDPNFEGGFNTRVAYKGFDLSTVGVFKSGGILISTLYNSNGYLNLETGRRNNVKIDYWTPENTDAKYPRPGVNISGDNPRYGTTLGYFSASYLKIRTITLGYDFNHSLLKGSNLRLRMYATVQNPFVLFSPYHDESGMDPETNSYGNENQAVTSYPRRFLTIGTNTPSTRNYILGLNLSF